MAIPAKRLDQAHGMFELAERLKRPEGSRKKQVRITLRL